MELDLEEVSPAGNINENQRSVENSPSTCPPLLLTTVCFVALNLAGLGDGGGCVDAGNASVQIVWTATGFSAAAADPEIFSALPALDELIADPDRRNMPDRRPFTDCLLPRRSPARLKSESDPCCWKSKKKSVTSGFSQLPSPTDTSLSAPLLLARSFSFPIRPRFFFLVPLGKSL